MLTLHVLAGLLAVLCVNADDTSTFKTTTTSATTTTAAATDTTTTDTAAQSTDTALPTATTTITLGTDTVDLFPSTTATGTGTGTATGTAAQPTGTTRIASEFYINISFGTGFTVQDGTEWKTGPGSVSLVGPIRGGNRPIEFKYKADDAAEEQTWNCLFKGMGELPSDALVVLPPPGEHTTMSLQWPGGESETILDGACQVKQAEVD